MYYTVEIKRKRSSFRVLETVSESRAKEIAEALQRVLFYCQIKIDEVHTNDDLDDATDAIMEKEFQDELYDR